VRNEFESGGGASSGTRKKILSCPYTFLALQVRLVVLVSAFVIVSTVWSVCYLLFLLYSWRPTCPAIWKSEWGCGARAPCHMESALPSGHSLKSRVRLILECLFQTTSGQVAWTDHGAPSFFPSFPLLSLQPTRSPPPLISISG